MPVKKRSHAILKTYGKLRHCCDNSTWTIHVSLGKGYEVYYQSIPNMYNNVRLLMLNMVCRVESSQYGIRKKYV